MNKDEFLSVARQIRANFPRNTIKVIVVVSAKQLDRNSVVYRIMIDPGGFRTNREQVSWSRKRDAAQAQCDKCNEWLNEVRINNAIKQHSPEDETMLLAALGRAPDDK